MHLQRSPLSNIRDAAIAMTLWTLGYAHAASSSLSNKSIDQFFVQVFCGFEALLMLSFILVAAIASKRGHRIKTLRGLTPWMLAACVISTLVVSIVHSDGEPNYDNTFTAIYYGVIALTLIAIGLTVYAAMVSRKTAQR